MEEACSRACSRPLLLKELRRLAGITVLLHWNDDVAALVGGVRGLEAGLLDLAEVRGFEG